MFAAASCLNSLEGCFCEKFSSGWLLQPINSITSLTFVLLAIYILLFLRKGLKNYWQRYYFNLFASALIITGLGSTYYHSRFNMLGQTIDFFGMLFILIIGPIVYFFKRHKLKVKQSFLVLFTLSTFLFLLVIKYPEIRRHVFGIGILVLIINELLTTRLSKRYFIIGLCVFVLSFAFWILDNYKIKCSENIFLNLHSWWHILNTIACFFIYKHFMYKIGSKISS